MQPYKLQAYVSMFTDHQFHPIVHETTETANLSDRNSPMRMHPIEPLRKEPMKDIVNV